jgi:hypothetical protein
MAAILPIVGTTILQGVLLGGLFAGSAEIIHDVANFVRKEIYGDNKQQPIPAVSSTYETKPVKKTKYSITSFPDFKKELNRIKIDLNSK